MEAEPNSSAPAVVAVVVACDPGPWFEQALQSLAVQDYPNLSVVVVDCASAVEVAARVAEVLPGAFVRRLEQRVGFGRASNEVLQLVEGASHYLLCHDDVALAPDAVRQLVEEAFRSNAGIATPKFVQWEQPDRLLAVGRTADKVGVVQDLVDPGELDQQQHDAVREVFVAPGGATLVRADLFRTLGGFDADVDQFGEDLDLSWRARVAGARVVAVPSARVQHFQAVLRGQRAGWTGVAARQRGARLAEEHRLRTVLSCYRWFDAAWVAMLALLFALGEAVTRLAQGRPGDAWRAVASPTAALRHPRRLWAARRRVQRHRRSADRPIRRLQSRGNARFRAFLRARVDGPGDGSLPAPLAGSTSAGTGVEAPPEDPAGAGRQAPEASGPVGAEAPATRAPAAGGRAAAAFAAAVLTVLVIGSRSLLGHELPAVGGLPNLSAGWSHAWSAWWSTARPGGLGVPVPASPALALLALAGLVLGGAVGTLQHIVVLGPLLLGPLGAYRAARWWASPRGRIAALLVYAVVPVPYNALAHGHWAGLIGYAAAPWVLSALGRLSGEPPFPSTRVGWVAGRVVGLGVLVAAAAAVAPAFLLVPPLAGAALAGGSFLVRRGLASLRMAGVGLASSAVAAVLLMPWSARVLGSGNALLGVPAGPAGRLGLGAVLRFQTGPVGHGPLGWGLVAVAALPLVIGRSWRLAWAARLWTVALVFDGAVWAGSRGWIPALPPEVGLAPAAAALALSAALGAVAFEMDLPGYRFGWRQLSSGVAVAALALGSLPMLAAAGNGRWDLPSADASSVLAFLQHATGGDYRVLWVGAPDALPTAGHRLHTGMAVATSYDGLPGVEDLWVGGGHGAVGPLEADLRLVGDRLTTKLGHLLAPMAIRYIVIPTRNAPAGSGAVRVPTPRALLAGLPLQTDLQALTVDPDYVVYRNDAWAPATVLLPASADGVAAASNDVGRRLLQQTDLSGARPVLSGGPARWRGSLPGGSTLYVAVPRDPSWRLDVAGTSRTSRTAFGWAMRFAVPAGAGGVATLGAPPSAGARAAHAVEILLWVVAVALAALDLRRRRARDPDPETLRPEWFSRPSGPGRRGSVRAGGPPGPEDLSGDEVWMDA